MPLKIAHIEFAPLYARVWSCQDDRFESVKLQSKMSCVSQAHAKTVFLRHVTARSQHSLGVSTRVLHSRWEKVVEEGGGAVKC